MREISNFIEKSSKAEHGLPFFETENQLLWVMQVHFYSYHKLWKSQKSKLRDTWLLSF